MKSTRAAFIHSADLERYHYPPDCPFRTERAAEARRILLSMGLLNGENRREVPPTPASRERMETFHAPEYLEALEDAAGGHMDVEGLWMGLGTPDCPVFRSMDKYAALACGATVTAAELILAGEADVAFNPSGGYHHARSAEASGFCYVNDVAIGCLRLVEAGRRVLFLDVDAHHGDGVQEAFYARKDVMTVSLHESGLTLFPGTGFPDEIGTGEGRGYAVNVPVPADVFDEAYLRAFHATALPLIGAYDPDVIVLELGMDGLSGDPLTHMSLTNNAYADVIEAVLGFGRPIVATGGGGYHVGNTARGWALAWSVFCGEEGGQDDLAAGLGGVMLETTEWMGGLRDRAIVPASRQRNEVESAVDSVIEKVKANVFPYHGL